MLDSLHQAVFSLGAGDDGAGRVHPAADEGRPLRQQTLNVAEQRMEIERLSEKGDAGVEDDLI